MWGHLGFLERGDLRKGGGMTPLTNYDTVFIKQLTRFGKKINAL